MMDAIDRSRYLPLEGSLLNPKPPAPVAGGNVETSQRNVDALFRAFSRIMPKRVYAACSGSMNNIAIKVLNPRTHGPFTYYETVAGGMGGRCGVDGIDGVHTNMTNTGNTPVEAIERNYPLMVLRYGLRRDSGGAGRWRGGLGIVREYKILADEVKISLLGDRQRFRPWGLMGAETGNQLNTCYSRLAVSEFA